MLFRLLVVVFAFLFSISLLYIKARTLRKLQNAGQALRDSLQAGLLEAGIATQAFDMEDLVREALPAERMATMFDHLRPVALRPNLRRPFDAEVPTSDQHLGFSARQLVRHRIPVLVTATEVDGDAERKRKVE